MNARSEPGQANVLIVAHSVDNAQQVRGLLLDDFASVEVSTVAGEEMTDFERVQPQVLVLAYRDLEACERTYLNLLRKSRVAHAHPHRAIILCETHDVVAAFDLCKKGNFDDYVLYWPQTHDPRRLAMSVWVACRELAAAPAQGIGSAELVLHARRLRAMEGALESQLEAGARHAAAVRDAMEKTRSAYAGATSQTLGALAASRDAVKPISDWAEQLGSEITPHIAEVRQIADTLGAVRPRLMVVEDDPFAAKLVKKALDGQPWQVGVASDGAAAFAMLRADRPAAILMDVNLPDVDGVVLTEQLKMNPALADIPILMLTSDARRDILARSMRAGANGFIVKPFTSTGLAEKLAPYLS